MTGPKIVLPNPPPPSELVRSTCERCALRGAALEAVAAGRPPSVGYEPPSIEDIRWATDTLAAAEAAGAPYGKLLAIGKGKSKLLLCPRCTNVGTDETPVPLLEAFDTLNRKERRQLGVDEIRALVRRGLEKRASGG